MSADVASAIGSIAAAIVSVLALGVALRSASAAEKSASVASAALHRSAIRELVGICHEVCAEELRVQTLATALRSEYTSLFVFSGTSGGSQETKLKGALEEHVTSSTQLGSEARSLADDAAKMHIASDADLDQMSARLSSSRMKIRALRESIENQLTEARAMNQIYREKKI